MTLSRRQFLVAGTAAGAVLLARPSTVFAQGLGPSASAGARTSRLFPELGRRLVHADLHNHSLLSDGDGDAAAAFTSMRAFGVDVAALTDHAGTGKLQGDSCQGCAQAIGIDEGEWQRIGEYANSANDDGSFVAIRGFEWSSPVLGHMNVWFSSTWTDPLATAGVGTTSAIAFASHQDGNPLTPEQEAAANDALRTAGDPASMQGFYEWLSADPARPVVGGGGDGLAGFNHPGREGGRFGLFQYDPALRDRVVSIELFNRGEDYLFEQVPGGAPSPLVECLDAGWRVGTLGVSDEHGTEWGKPEGKGRTGLWLKDFSRAGVREALLARRFFSTRERGLRIDAAADGVQMGGFLDHAKGPVTFSLDIDKGTDWFGRSLRVQVLQTGRPLPTVVHEEDVVVPRDDQPVISFRAPIDRDNGRWVVLRITDPSKGADDRSPEGSSYRSAGRAVAYTSPFFLEAGPAPVVPEMPSPAAAVGVAALGVAGAFALQARRAHHHAQDGHEHA